MKISKLLLLGILLTVIYAHAQQPTTLSLNDAVAMALSKSDEVKLANTKAVTRGYDLESVKNNRYPDVKISGQYLRLANADINLRSTQEATSDPNATPPASPKVNQLMLGQANVTMPLFSGFRLKNSIVASEKLYEAELANAAYTREEIAMRVIRYYADLYKVQKSVELFTESLKSGQQRVTDFQAMEQNGLIARNELLKAQLQLSRYQLSLDEAQKNIRLLSFSLNTLLKLPLDTQIVVNPDNVDPDLFSRTVETEAEVLQLRKDLIALGLTQEAAEANIKVAKSNYFPSVSIVGGYTALDLQNVVRVENAMNVGVGLSYNLSSIFKNSKDVNAAKSRALEVNQQQLILTDHIKMEIVGAREEYELAVKQDLVYQEAVGQANENYRIVKDKYDNGLSDTNDLLEADVEDLSAKINQAYAKANLVLKYYELLDASGQLTQSFNFTQK